MRSGKVSIGQSSAFVDRRRISRSALIPAVREIPIEPFDPTEMPGLVLGN
jgi:hypothetical protein